MLESSQVTHRFALRAMGLAGAGLTAQASRAAAPPATAYALCGVIAVLRNPEHMKMQKNAAKWLVHET
jgi:hypothetical protein